MATPNTLLSYAIVGEDEAKEYAQINAPDEAKQDVLRLIVNSVTEQVERYTRRPWKSRQFVELYDGNGASAIVLRQMPLITLTSVKRLNSDGTTAYTYTDADFVLSLERGIIQFRYGQFWSGFQNYQITYTAGYASVPDDVRLAALIAVAAAWRDFDQKREDMESLSFEGETKTFSKEDLAPKAKKRLDRYRLGAGA